MSAWEVYLILQLDSIHAALVAVSLLSALAATAVFLAGILGLEASSPRGAILSWLAALVLTVSLTGVTALAVALLPTTKTAAAIYIVPRLTTDENVDALKSEAGEVYGLFKDWLEQQAQGEGE